MRLFILSAVFFVASTACFAQKTSLSFDEQGKYIFYEVVEIPTVSKDSLINRAQYFFNFFKKKSIKLISISGDSLVNAEGKFIIKKGVNVLTHPSGEVLFNFVAELKHGKYRYWLTDFRFNPYQRDRYANFVPAGSVHTPFENKPGKLNAQEWKDNIASTEEQAYSLGESFKKILAGKYFNTESKPKSISKKKW